MTGSSPPFLRLIPIGEVSPGLCEAVAGGISRRLNAPCAVVGGALEPEFAHDARRGQYCSTRLLERLREEVGDGGGVVLGVADVDLFMPVLTFVFGEAILGAGVAIVSLHRLRQGVYGLPEDPALALSRAEREAVHEVGHAIGLVHCPDFTCPMHATRSVEEIDLAAGRLCGGCGARMADAVHAFLKATGHREFRPSDEALAPFPAQRLRRLLSALFSRLKPASGTGRADG